MEMEQFLANDHHHNETSEISILVDSKVDNAKHCVINAWDDFLHTSNCSSLNLESLHLTDADLSMLHDRYKKNDIMRGEAKQLNSVQIISCSFQNERAVKSLVDFLKDAVFLEEIILENIHYRSFMEDPILVNLLNEMLEQKIHLKRISIGQMHITGRDIGSCLEDLLSDEGAMITDMIFHSCHFDQGSFEGLTRGLLLHKNGLEKLGLIYSLRSSRDFDLLVQTILQSSTRRSIQELSISDSKATVWNVVNNPLSGSSSFASMSSLLRQCQSIKILNLGDCRDLFENVREDTKSYVCFLKALKDNKTLQKLNMRGCCITDKLSEPFFQALEKNTALQELHLECGPSSIMESLSKSLPRLHLSVLGANVDLENRRFRKALYANKTLIQIDLGHNRAFAGREIIGILQRNWQLRNVMPRLLRHTILTPETWPDCAWRLCKDHPGDLTTVYALLQSTSAQVVAWGESVSRGHKN